jgi:hypothetical protein
MVSCKFCKKKTNSIYLMECNFCDKKYCISCRTPEDHKCSEFNQRDREKERTHLLEKHMPKIEFEKMEKI